MKSGERRDESLCYGHAPGWLRCSWPRGSVPSRCNAAGTVTYMNGRRNQPRETGHGAALFSVGCSDPALRMRDDG